MNSTIQSNRSSYIDTQKSHHPEWSCDAMHYAYLTLLELVNKPKGCALVMSSDVGFDGWRQVERVKLC